MSCASSWADQSMSWFVHQWTSFSYSRQNSLQWSKCWHAGYLAPPYQLQKEWESVFHYNLHIWMSLDFPSFWGTSFCHGFPQIWRHTNQAPVIMMFILIIRWHNIVWLTSKIDWFEEGNAENMMILSAASEMVLNGPQVGSDSTSRPSGVFLNGCLSSDWSW